MEYVATYTHQPSDRPALFWIDADTDEEAMAKLRHFVSAGYRNSTQATIELSNGRGYGASNRHGNAIGKYLY